MTSGLVLTVAPNAVAGKIFLKKQQWLLFLAWAMKDKFVCMGNGKKKLTKYCVNMFHHVTKGENTKSCDSECLQKMLYIVAQCLMHSFHFTVLCGCIRTRRRLCMCESTLLWVFTLCSPTPLREIEALSHQLRAWHTRRPVSPGQYIWMNRFQSHIATPALYFWNIHFICMPDVLSVFHYGSSCSGLGHICLIRVEAMLGCCYGKVEDSASFRAVKNNLACAVSHSKPSAILSAKAHAFPAFYLFKAGELFIYICIEGQNRQKPCYLWSPAQSLSIVE